MVGNVPGIDTKYFDKVFPLFQTLDARDKVKGTGVGLALVKKIVEAEDGEIWLESTLGSGATFHFTLPAAATRNAQRATNNEQSPERGSR